MKEIAIIGTGAYGLSIALSLLKKNKKIKMWVESKERADFLNNNKSYPYTIFNRSITFNKNNYYKIIN